MWVIRGGDGDLLVVPFVTDGVIGIEYDEVPDAEILTRLEIRKSLDRKGTSAEFDAHEATVSAFVREIQVGDSVLLLDSSRSEVVVGTVVGPYEFHGDVEPGGCRHRRRVEWLARHRLSDLPDAVQGVAKQKLPLEQHRDAEWAGYLVSVRDGDIGRDPADRGAMVTAPARPRSAASRPDPPRAPKPAAVAHRTCPSCHLQTHPDRFIGDYCYDCAE